MSIGNSAFSECTNLKKFKPLDESLAKQFTNLETIYDKAFKNCKSLEYLGAPNLKSFGKGNPSGQFQGCKNLTLDARDHDVRQWDGSKVTDCKYLITKHSTKDYHIEYDDVKDGASGVLDECRNQNIEIKENAKIALLLHGNYACSAKQYSLEELNFRKWIYVYVTDGNDKKSAWFKMDIEPKVWDWNALKDYAYLKLYNCELTKNKSNAIIYSTSGVSQIKNSFKDDIFKVTYNNYEEVVNSEDISFTVINPHNNEVVSNLENISESINLDGYYLKIEWNGVIGYLKLRINNNSTHEIIIYHKKDGGVLAQSDHGAIGNLTVSESDAKDELVNLLKAYYVRTGTTITHDIRKFI